jgi:integrase
MTGESRSIPVREGRPNTNSQELCGVRLSSNVSPPSEQRLGKTLRRLTLGRFPTLGLAAAREKATDALREAAKGQDPGRQKIDAIEHEWLEANPCHMVRRPGEEKQRERVLSEDEIRLVWKALDGERPLIATLFRIRLLTAQRGGEVHGAAWSELDLATGWWTIPAERSKNGLAHRVPLSPQALRILKPWRQTVDDSVWVFPSSRQKGPHIAHAQKAIERIVRASGVQFRGHDLRRTAASLMVGAGVPRLVVSKILNHVETGVTAVYDRHGYDLEKRAALDLWGKRLDQIVSGKRSKVLAFVARG